MAPELVKQQHTLSLLCVGYIEGQVTDVCICHASYRTQLNEGGLAERKLPEISSTGELYSKFDITYIVVKEIREVAGLFSMLLTSLVCKIIHCRWKQSITDCCKTMYATDITLRIARNCQRRFFKETHTHTHTHTHTYIYAYTYTL
jgi:hypothetical protein